MSKCRIYNNEEFNELDEYYYSPLEGVIILERNRNPEVVQRWWIKKI
jgi:hypothetical protein